METATPDGLFYYSLTIALAGALLFVIIRYTGKVDSTLKDIGSTLGEVSTMLKVHEHRLDDIDSDISDLKADNRIVKYKR